jgi:hypothetical protein
VTTSPKGLCVIAIAPDGSRAVGVSEPDESPITHAVFEPDSRGRWTAIAWIRHWEHGALLLRQRPSRVMVPALPDEPCSPARPRESVAEADRRAARNEIAHWKAALKLARTSGDAQNVDDC